MIGKRCAQIIGLSLVMFVGTSCGDDDYSDKCEDTKFRVQTLGKRSLKLLKEAKRYEKNARDWSTGSGGDTLSSFYKDMMKEANIKRLIMKNIDYQMAVEMDRSPKCFPNGVKDIYPQSVDSLKKGQQPQP